MIFKGLEEAIGKVVVNETDLKDRYEIALYWDPDDPSSIVAAIKDQLGLKLMKETMGDFKKGY